MMYSATWDAPCLVVCHAAHAPWYGDALLGHLAL
jgi:hypothetical protein